MHAVLKIHCISEQSRLAGHSWIDYRPAAGPRNTFGTWGNDPVGTGNGLLEGLEMQYVATHTRTAVIDADQEKRLFDVIARYAAAGDAGWSMTSPCSAFAAAAWEAATGERLVHRIAGISTPKTLSSSIAAANASQNADVRNEQAHTGRPHSIQKNSLIPKETRPRKRGRNL